MRHCVITGLTFPKCQISDFSKVIELADDNFNIEENG